MPKTISLTRQHKVDGEVLTFSDVVICNGLIAVDVSVLPSTAKQAQPFAATASLLQSVYIGASQPITLYSNGTNAVQTVTVTGSPTAGVLALSGTTPAAWTASGIPWNATAAQVATAVQNAIVLVAGGPLTTVTGSGGPLPGTPVVLTFGGTLGLGAVATITANVSGLTGGSPACTPTSTTTGVAPSQTWTIPANDAIEWAAQDGYFSNPITANITQLSVSNLNTAAVLVNVRMGTN